MERYIVVSKDKIYQTETLFGHIIDDIAFYRVVDTVTGKELVDGCWYNINEMEDV